MKPSSANLLDEFHTAPLLLNSRMDVEVHGHGDGGVVKTFTDSA